MTTFRANPVFLWMHDSGGGETTPPPDVVIGRVTNFDQSVDALDIEVEFDDDGDGLGLTWQNKLKRGKPVLKILWVLFKTATELGLLSLVLSLATSRDKRPLLNGLLAGDTYLMAPDSNL